MVRGATFLVLSDIRSTLWKAALELALLRDRYTEWSVAGIAKMCQETFDVRRAFAITCMSSE